MESTNLELSVEPGHGRTDSALQRDQLLDAVLSVSEQHGEGAVLQLIVDRARDLLRARFAALGVPDELGDGMVRFYFAGVSQDEADRIGPPPSHHGLLGVMLRPGAAIHVPDVLRDPRSAGFPAGHPPVHELLGVPIRQAGQVLGDLYVANPEHGGAFSEDDQRTLELLAKHAGLAVANARLVEQLRRSEARFRLLAEEAPDLVFALDGSGVVTFANEHVLQMTGLEIDRALGEPLQALFDPADRSIVALNLRALDSGAARVSFAASTVVTGGDRRHLDVSIVRVEGDAPGYQGIARDVTAERALGQEVSERTSELLATMEERQRLGEFVALIIQAQEDERARIAGDLHDTTVQTLTAIGRRLHSLAEAPGADDVPRSELTQLADAALAEADEVRRLSRNLRPSVLDHLGLEAALETLVRDAERNGLDASLEVAGDASRVGTRQRTALFRIAQEALTNVRRHSQATWVRVSLTVGNDEAHLQVIDNGTGFDRAAVLEGGERRQRLGLAGMQQRALMYAGALEIASEENAGTCVDARLPLG